MVIKRCFSTFLLIILLFSIFINLQNSDIKKLNTEKMSKNNCYENLNERFNNQTFIYSNKARKYFNISKIEQYQLAELDYTNHINQLEDCNDLLNWYYEYKNIIEHYKIYIDSPETIYDCFTEEEIYLIQRCVETETHGADFESKTHVASVIFNRYDSGIFGDTIKDIIIPGQFAFFRKSIEEETILAVEFAFEIKDTTNGCLYFHSNSKTKTFNNAQYQFTDEVGHHFYK